MDVNKLFFILIFLVPLVIFLLIYFRRNNRIITFGDVGTEEEKNSNINEKVDVINEVLHFGLHISTLETEFGKNGKFISRQAIKNTNIFYFIIFIYSFLPFFLKDLCCFNIPWFLIPISLAIIIFVFIIIFRWIIERKVRSKIRSNNNYFVKLFQKDGNHFWGKVFINQMTVVPFSIKHIWWLILIFGVINVQYDTLEEFSKQRDFSKSLYIIDGSFDTEMFNFYLEGFLKTLIISLVAYIITNVIREITLLREKYIEGTEHVKGLNKQLGNSKKDFKKISDTIDATTFGATILEFQDKFTNARSPVTKLITKANRFIKETSELTKSMNSSIEQDDDKFIQMGILSARISLIINQSKRIKEGHKGSILTPWVNLGSISKYLMDDIYSLANRNNKSIEIYALQLKTPKQFIIEKYINHNNLINRDDTDEWREFVNENIINKRKKKINIKRYFAKINPDLIENVNERPEEYVDLLSTGDSLDDELFIKTESRDIINHNKKAQVIFQSIEDNTEPKSLKVILGEHVHKKNNCFIRIFDTNELELILETSGNGYKPKFIDYLAFCETDTENNQKEWLFCVKSLYDKGFDAAKVSLISKNDTCPIWSVLKDNLSRVFLDANNDNCKEITAY